MSSKLVCPACRGHSVKHTSAQNIAHGLHHTAIHEAKHVPLFGLAAGALSMAIMGFAEKWVCESCGHKFTGKEGACVRCTGPGQRITNCCSVHMCMPCCQDLAEMSAVTCHWCDQPKVVIDTGERLEG